MEKELQKIQNELSSLKSDVAEIKNLIREIHTIFLPPLKVKKTLTRKQKKECKKQNFKKKED